MVNSPLLFHCPGANQEPPGSCALLAQAGVESGAQAGVETGAQAGVESGAQAGVEASGAPIAQ